MSTYAQLQPVPFESIDNSVLVYENDDSQRGLLNYFISQPTPMTVTVNDNNHSLIQELSNFMSQPKDVFVAKLIEFTKENTDELDLIRMELLKVCKKATDFPYPNSTLKRRLESRSKSCDSLSVKLAKDCHSLMIASNGTYLNELNDVLSVKSHRATPSESENQSQNTLLKETVSRVDRDVITLRGEFVQDSEYLNKKVKSLTDSNEKLCEIVTKQTERMQNLQHQINIIRDGKLQKELDSVSKRCADMESKFNNHVALTKTVDTIEKSVRELTEIVKSTKESNDKNTSELVSLKTDIRKIEHSLKLESDRLNKVQDQHQVGIL